MRHVSVKERIHHDGAARFRQQLAAQSDQPAAGHAKLHAHAAVAVVVHLQHLALARAQLFNHHTDVVFRDVHGQRFHRLAQLSIHNFGYNFRPAYLSSKPSRRIISIRMESCSSPRPSTLKASGEVSSTRNATLVSSSPPSGHASCVT